MCYGDVLIEIQTGSNSNNRLFKCAFFLLRYFSRSETYLEVILHYLPYQRFFCFANSARAALQSCVTPYISIFL